MTAHAYAVIDAFVYGFALQEASLPATAGDEMADLAQSLSAAMPAGEYHVQLTNPDQQGATWSGVFVVTTTPPPGMVAMAWAPSMAPPPSNVLQRSPAAPGARAVTKASADPADSVA